MKGEPHIDLFNKNARIYQRLMQELGSRICQVDVWLSQVGKRRDVNANLITLECCYLQVRMSCELVALGLAACHEGLGYSRKVTKAYHAVEIMDGIARLRSDYYPVPALPYELDNATIGFQSHGKPYLGADGIKEIYNRCGDILHRARARDVLAGATKSYSIRELKFWSKTFKETFSSHLVRVNDRTAIYAVVAFEVDVESSVHVVYSPSGVVVKSYSDTV